MMADMVLRTVRRHDGGRPLPARPMNQPVFAQQLAAVRTWFYEGHSAAPQGATARTPPSGGR
jgi:hypothetical protein